MVITFNNRRFEILTFSLNELKDIVKNFKLKNNIYFNYNLFEIREFVSFFDELALQEVDLIIKRYEFSYSQNCDELLPCKENFEYLPYQKSGIYFSSINDNVLIADEMGLGKTIQAIGLINDFLAKNGNITSLIICPATLKINWKREIDKWLIKDDINVEIVNKKTKFEKGIFILNYDICHNYKKILSKIEFDLLVLDEVHYLKNKKSRRTQSVLGKLIGNKRIGEIKSKKKLFLTGTPILNRPIELFNIVNSLFPKIFFSEMQFARKFCDAKHNGFGWDFKGSSNLEELNFLLRTNGMIRRMKSDVLKQLPEKIRTIIEVEVKSGKEIIRDDFEEGIEYIENITKKIPFEKQALFKKEVGLSKVEFVKNHIIDILENDPIKKIVVFGWHIEVIEKLFNDLVKYNPVKITGSSTFEDRDISVQKFQNDENCRLFIGNIVAAGVGLTLTRSNHVVIAELSWDPSSLAQAEDRCHRIGQKDVVLIEYFIAHKTIESKIAQSLLSKIKIINQTLN